MCFKKLCQLHPSYVYNPEPKKTVIVVDENDEEAANACFHNFGIKVVNGYRFIGSKELTKQLIEDKIDAWLVCVDKLAGAAEPQPQAAYAAMAKSMQFGLLLDKINKIVWPAFVTVVTARTLPVHIASFDGRNDVNDPVETAGATFATSRAYTDVIVIAIKGKEDFSVYDHLQKMSQAKKEMNHEVKGLQENKLTSIVTSLSDGKKQVIQREVCGKTSIWLADCTFPLPF